MHHLSKTKTKPEKLTCYACGKHFSSKLEIRRHLKNLVINALYQCAICQRVIKSDNSCCDHKEVNKTFHCRFCGIQIDPPYHFHICFHMSPNKALDKRKCDKIRKTDLKKRYCRVQKRKPDTVLKIKEEFVKVAPDREYPEDKEDVNEFNDESKFLIFSDSDYKAQLFGSDSDDTDKCIYCNMKMSVHRLSRHEAWHRKFDKNVKMLTETKTLRLQSNTEGLCAYCGVMKPGNKLRRHEYVEHVKKYVRKVCDICGIFTCPTYIKEHMRTHDAVKGFKCEVCGKAFFRKKALSRHRLVHSDEARYMCTVCGKSFKIKFNLRVHMRTHEDVKPFPCSVCKKTFTTKQWRDNHLKTHGIIRNR